MYRLTEGAGVIRLWDGAHVPAAPGNRDWQAYEAWLAGGGVPESAPELPPAAISVSRLRLKLELAERELLDDIDAAVTAAGVMAQLYWAEATQFESDHALVAAIGGAIGLSSAQIRELFEAARDREA